MNFQLGRNVYMCSEMVTLTSEDRYGDSQTVTGNLEGIGEWSAVVLTEVPFAPGAQIRMSADVHHLEGRVSSWSFEPLLGYFVEVQLNPESRWAKEGFRPRHFLAPLSIDNELQSDYVPEAAAA